METTPVSMRLTSGDLANLDTIKKLTGLSSRTEVVRHLCAFYLVGCGLQKKIPKKRTTPVLTP